MNTDISKPQLAIAAKFYNNNNNNNDNILVIFI